MSIKKITNSNFSELVLGEDKPVMLDFWATWCGPCKMIAPTLEELGAERDDFIIGKIDIDEEPELAEKFGIMSIPTIVTMKSGAIINKSVGVKNKEQLLELLND